MVAYSFKRRFVDPIKVGLGLVVPAPAPLPKRQTARAGRKRHVRVGETVHLYCAMRTRQCFKIGEACCTYTRPIILTFTPGPLRPGVVIELDGQRLNWLHADDFARDDGFTGLDDFIAFWREEHGAPERWEGVVIYWEPLQTAL